MTKFGARSGTVASVNRFFQRRRGRPPHPDVLTPAEWRVLEEVRGGYSNAEIAVRLGLSPNTVKTHLSRIMALSGSVWDLDPAYRDRVVRVFQSLAP